MPPEITAILAAGSATRSLPAATHLLIRLLTHRVKADRTARIAEEAPSDIGPVVMKAKAEIEAQEGVRIEDLPEDRVRHYVGMLERFAYASSPHADEGRAADTLAALRAENEVGAPGGAAPGHNLTRATEREILASLDSVASPAFTVRHEALIGGEGPMLAIDAILVDVEHGGPDVLVEVKSLATVALSGTAETQATEALVLLDRYRARTGRPARLWLIYVVDAEPQGDNPLAGYLRDAGRDVRATIIVPTEAASVRVPYEFLGASDGL